VTVIAQRQGEALRPLERFGLLTRLENGVASCAGYLWKMLWPTKLAAFYPHPGSDIPVWSVAVSAVTVAAITVAVVKYRRSRPYLLFGWAWYLITLAPVLGVVQVGAQAMADRYTYIPLIGVFTALSLLAEDAFPARASGKKTPIWKRSPLTIPAFVIVAALGALTFRQTTVWKDSRTLFAHAAAVTINNTVAYNNLGLALMESGDLSGSVEAYENAIEIEPNAPMTHNNLGLALMKSGDLDGAIERFSEAIQLKPDYAKARHNLGLALFKSRRFSESADAFGEAARLSPGFAQSHYMLSVSRYLAGDYRGALEAALESRRLGLPPKPELLEAIDRKLAGAPASPDHRP